MVSAYKKLVMSKPMNWLGIPIVFVTGLLIISIVFMGRFSENHEKENIQALLNDSVTNANILLDKWAESRISATKRWSDLASLKDYARELVELHEKGGDFKNYHLNSAYQEEMDHRVLEQGLLGYFIIAPDGTNLASMRESNIGIKNVVMLSLPDIFSRVLAGESIVTRPMVSDVPVLSVDGEISTSARTIFVMTPIFGDDGEVMAVLANRQGHDGSFSTIFEYFLLGYPGEVYMFDSRGRMLTESRFKDDLVERGMLQPGEDSVLNIFIKDPGAVVTHENVRLLNLEKAPPTLMAKSARDNGKGSSIEGYRDYRGEQVIGGWTWNDNLGVGIAVELDAREAFAAMHTMLTYFYAFSFFVIITFLSAGGIMQWLSRRNQKNLTDLISEQERNHAILNSAGEGIYGVDMDGITTFANPMVSDILGFSLEELVGRNMHDMVHHSHPDGRPFPIEDCVMREMLVSGEKGRASNEIFWHKDGYTVPVSYTTTPMLEKGKLVGGVVTFRDATSEIESVKKIETMMEEARAANRAKSIFLSSMSHELRTPLNAVMGFGQLLLLDKDKFTKKHVDQVNYIISSGEHLLSLINDVLELSKIDAGEMSMSMEGVDVADAIEQSLAMISNMASNRHIEIENVWKIKQNPMFRSDLLRAKQCLINILSNAVKYNHEGGKIVVDTTVTEDGYLRIIVTDTGMGIPKARIKDLWEPFNRLGAETGDVEGTGIGLCVTKDILALLGGRIGVESQVGIGSKFWIDFPLAETHEKRERKIAHNEASSMALEEVDFSLFADKFIYCVEDNPSNEAVLKNIFHAGTGVKLVVAKTGEEAVAALSKLAPDAILIDINLPGINGFEVMKNLSSMKHMKDIPIFAVTANVEPVLKRKSQGAGFTGFLLKPLQVNYLHGLLKKAMGL